MTRSTSNLVRSIIGLGLFVTGAFIILYLTVSHYLLPALAAANNLEPSAKKHLAAISALVLAVVLTALVALAILVIRPGRFFLPGKGDDRSVTRYTDAWAEAGRRAEVPPDEEEGSG